MRVGGPENRRPGALAVAYIALQADGVIGQDLVLERESGAHIRYSAVALGRGTRQKRQACFQIVSFTLASALHLGSRSSVLKDAQHGPIRHRPQRPLPVIVFRGPSQRPQLDGLKKRVQRDIHHHRRTGPQADAIPQCRQEGGRRYLEAVGSRKQIVNGIKTVLIGEDLQSASGRTQHFDRRSHLRDTSRATHIAGDRTRTVGSQRRKRQAEHHDEESELSQHHSTSGVKRATRSTAKVAVGSTVCLEMWSLTLISIRYEPGSRLLAERVFCSVTWSPTFPICSVDSVV